MSQTRTSFFREIHTPFWYLYYVLKIKTFGNYNGPDAGRKRYGAHIFYRWLTLTVQNMLHVGVCNNPNHNFLFPGSLFADEIHTIFILKEDMLRTIFHQTCAVSELNNDTKAEYPVLWLQKIPYTHIIAHTFALKSTWYYTTLQLNMFSVRLCI